MGNFSLGRERRLRLPHPPQALQSISPSCIILGNLVRTKRGMNLIQQLDYLFKPRSVAVIGASNIPGKWGCDILNLLLTRGERKVYPINKNRAAGLGVKAYPGLADV